MRALALALLACAALPAASLQDTLAARIAGFRGTVSLYAKNLETGATVGIRESDPVRTASTIKLAILCTVFDTVAHGKLKWTDPVTITKENKVSGSGIIASEISDGVQLPLRDVANLMIVLSDNTATNLVLDRVPADSVNAWLDSVGIKTTRSLRKILSEGPARGYSAAGKLPENAKFGIGVSTPRDMVSILEKLDRGEIVSPDASKQILAVLGRCQDSNGIRRKLPDLKVANKSGALDALRADLGIVYSPGGRIAMSITVDNMPKPEWTVDNPGLLLIADLARQIVDGLAPR